MTDGIAITQDSSPASGALRYVIESLGISQREFAALLGVSETVVSRKVNSPRRERAPRTLADGLIYLCLVQLHNYRALEDIECVPKGFGASMVVGDLDVAGRVADGHGGHAETSDDPGHAFRRLVDGARRARMAQRDEGDVS